MTYRLRVSQVAGQEPTLDLLEIEGWGSLSLLDSIPLSEIFEAWEDWKRFEQQ